MSRQKQSERSPAGEAASPGRGSCLTAEGGGDHAVFRDLVESSQCMIVILHLDRTIAYFNPFAQQLTGYSPDAVEGEDYIEVFVPDLARPVVEECFQKVISGASTGEIEHPLVANTGTTRWVVCSFRSFGKYQGKPAVLLTAQDITVHKYTEETLRRRTHDLGERIKELNCLFGLSKLVEKLGTDLEGIIQRLVDILPPGWQYPEVTCGRIVFEGRPFTTYNFRETGWKQTAPISVHGRPAGTIEVYYLEEKPPMHEGPFLVEERRLIDALAEQLGRIAERIKAERELRREKDFAESLIETAPAIVLVLDAEGRIVRINPYMEEISGYRLEDVKGKDWLDTFIPKRNRERTRRLFLRTVGKKQRQGDVGPIVAKDGREREIEWYDKRLEDAGGNLIGLLAIGQDITNRRKLEKEISEISTREQQRIGQELHDGLGQELTGLGYLAETLYCDLKLRKAAEVDMANTLAGGIERALEQARTIAKGLVPVEIDAGGLISALEQLVASTEHRCKIACRLRCDERTPVDDTATATQLFRIVQEAINNAVKHAGAKHIDVDLKADDRQIALEVRDDGKGISEGLEHTPGMGLRIMQYRAGVIGAVLSVQKASGGGTIVTCLMPHGDQ